MTDRDQEAIAFMEVVLGAKLVAEEPAEGTWLASAVRLGALVEEGQMTQEEMEVELVRLHPDRYTPSPPERL